MRKLVTYTALCLLGVCVLAAGVNAEEWNFSDINKIQIDGMSGDIVIRPAEGSQGRVELRADVDPERAFKPTVEQKRNTLYIEEKWRGRNSSGSVEWTIYLPQEGKAPRIRISNASGSLDCKNISAEIELDTASGSVELVEVELSPDSDLSTASGDYVIEGMTVREGTRFSTASGDIELQDIVIEDGCEFSTASGNIRCEECSGELELSSASGDVIVRNSKLAGKSSFSSASGDVSVRFDALPEQGFSASSASGRVTLDVKDFGDSYTLVMITREDRGRIDCPFEFTSERTFRDRHVFEEKIVERGSGGPEIELRTASGRVVVKE